MCTALGFRANHNLFGRTLDIDRTYGEEVVILPRGKKLTFRLEEAPQHFAMIGTAHVVQEQPLYYDAMNECGLCAAALNFPNFCRYIKTAAAGRKSVYSFEVIPWALRQCKDLLQARMLLEQTQILAGDFSENFPATPLHWMFFDSTGSFIMETTRDGMQFYDTPMDVMTNSPTYDWHLQNLSNHAYLSNQNRIGVLQDFPACSLGTGAMGLPGDYSSPSRFVKAAFLLKCSKKGETVHGNVAQFFRMMAAISPVRGSVKTAEGKDHYTVYASCMDASAGVYYYTTYENNRICAVDLRKENLDGRDLIRYPMMHQADVFYQN